MTTSSFQLHKPQLLKELNNFFTTNATHLIRKHYSHSPEMLYIVGENEKHCAQLFNFRYGRITISKFLLGSIMDYKHIRTHKIALLETLLSHNIIPHIKNNNLPENDHDLRYIIDIKNQPHLLKYIEKQMEVCDEL